VAGTIGGSLGGVWRLNLAPLSTLFLSTLAPHSYRKCWHSVHYFPVRLPHPNTSSALSASMYKQTHIRPNTKTHTF